MLQEVQQNQQVMAAELPQVRGEVEKNRGNFKALASRAEESERRSLETVERYGLSQIVCNKLFFRSRFRSIGNL